MSNDNNEQQSNVVSLVSSNDEGMDGIRAEGSGLSADPVYRIVYEDQDGSVISTEVSGNILFGDPYFGVADEDGIFKFVINSAQFIRLDRVDNEQEAAQD